MSIDWTKPLEVVYDDGQVTDAKLVDGELADCHRVHDGTNVWWAEKSDGQIIPCGHRVRNRADPETVTPEIAFLTDEQPTIRDQFAMAALTGILASEDYGAAQNFYHGASAATRSYEIADAMLAERGK